jgi:hypothetical protein
MAENSSNGKPARRIAKRFLAPIVATAASAAASYLAKKAPAYLEENVLPKLRSATSGAGGAAGSLPDRAKSVVGNVGNVAEDLTERAKAVVSTGNGGGGSSRRGYAPDELERRRAERAEAREARRKAAKG